MKSGISILAGLLAIAAGTPAWPAPSSASVLTALFQQACLPNLGKPDKVKAWAAEHHLPPVQDQAALKLFVGPSGDGEAWGVPSHEGQFALSIQGKPECAVFAREADPDEVRADLTRLMDGVKRPGGAIWTVKDDVRPSRWGQVRESIYRVTAPHAPVSFVFAIATVEKPGGRFQASILAEEVLSASR